MTHELLYLPYESHETLSIILIGSGLSAAMVLAFGLYMHWRGRHARKAARLAREERKAARKRRRH